MKKEYNWIRNTKTHMFIKPHFPFETREVVNLSDLDPKFREDILKAGAVAELKFLDDEQQDSITLDDALRKNAELQHACEKYEKIAIEATEQYKACFELLEREQIKSNKYYNAILKLRDGIQALNENRITVAYAYIDEAAAILK